MSAITEFTLSVSGKQTEAREACEMQGRISGF
jgi:hypothetical protein